MKLTPVRNSHKSYTCTISIQKKGSLLYCSCTIHTNVKDIVQSGDK